ncbi:MAG TPA: 2-C-methyl-D-erythritol 4-phosphate cytidylyltransferase [Candidatus Polarisedimenticolaceae bacterium]
MAAAGLVVAAGRATRFGGGVPKQFLDLGGRTLVERSIEALSARPGIGGVVVVVAPEDLGGARASALRSLSGVVDVVAGGTSRARSVASGLAALHAFEHVLVHDAARALVSAAVVDRVLAATLAHGAAIPVVPVRDTVKQDDGLGFVARTVDRGPLRLAQTPQGSRMDWLAEALARAEREGIEVTDEAQALERAGRPVALVDGDPGNTKITTPEDLAFARASLGGARPGELRVGTGFDVHRFGAGRRLVLGGVEFPGEVGLDGHSDADVVLHAAMDAVLGAAGLPDIGAFFPPGDPRYAGADSRVLAAEVSRAARSAGFSIVNLDLTVLAERPRIRPRVAAMRDAVAAAFGIEAGRVGLKATTLEGLGALGRGEGIACQAAALLRAEGASA